MNLGSGLVIFNSYRSYRVLEVLLVFLRNVKREKGWRPLAVPCLERPLLLPLMCSVLECLVFPYGDHVCFYGSS